MKGDPQVEAVVAVVRAVRPDILVLAGVDYDLTGVAVRALADRIEGYPYIFSARPNRGRQTGRDLDGDGKYGAAGDAVGFADFAGQKGMAILSRYPFDREGARNFSAFAWADLPGNLAPPGTPAMPLGTTVHWDIPVVLDDGQRLHLLTWHATAPVFDGPEDRNGRRNHDEAAFWLAYLENRLAEAPPQNFVLLGIANTDPYDGDGRPEALRSLLSRLGDARPGSEGAVEAALRDGGVNARHVGPSALDTADWEDGPRRPGNLRVDFVLPAPHLTAIDSGVFWPLAASSMAETVRLASRHRLVWVDLDLPGRAPN